MRKDGLRTRTRKPSKDHEIDATNNCNQNLPNERRFAFAVPGSQKAADALRRRVIDKASETNKPLSQTATTSTSSQPNIPEYHFQLPHSLSTFAAQYLSTTPIAQLQFARQHAGPTALDTATYETQNFPSESAFHTLWWIIRLWCSDSFYWSANSFFIKKVCSESRTAVEG